MEQKIKNISHEFYNKVEGDIHIIVMSGPVGDFGGLIEGLSAKKLRESLEGVDAKIIKIKLNSGGGDFFEGLEIKNLLADQKAKVIVEVTGLAASAASIIAMGADEVIMRNGSSMMIHEASTMAYGNKNDIKKTLNALETIDDSIVEIYRAKTGLSVEEISNMINGETWLTAEEAVSKGFADSYEKIEEDKSEIENLKSTIINMQKELKELKNKSEVVEGINEEPLKVAVKSRRFF